MSPTLQKAPEVWQLRQDYIRKEDERFRDQERQDSPGGWERERKEKGEEEKGGGVGGGGQERNRGGGGGGGGE